MYGDGFNPKMPGMPGQMPAPGVGGLPQFGSRRGMMGSSVPVPSYGTPQGRLGVAAREASHMQVPGGPGGMAGARINRGMVPAARPDFSQAQTIGREQPLSQEQREQMGANYGPQNAALAGYMMG